MTLVALLAMTTGAWAQTALNVAELTIPDTWQNDNTALSTNDLPGYQVATRGNAIAWTGAPEGYAMLFFDVTSSEIKSATFHNGNYSSDGSTSGLKHSTLYTWKNSASYRFFYTTAPAEPDVEVIISTDQQSAEFDMPSYDATLEYQIVRNLASNIGITVNGKQTWGDGTASIQVKKQEGEYPAASELITAVKDLTAGSSDIANENYTLKLQKLADDGETWSDIEQATAKQQPGTYRFVATAVDDKPYVGTAYGKFEITEGYEITVAAGEYATYYNNVALTIEDADAEMYSISNVTDTEAQLSDKLSIAPKETPLLIYNKGTEAKTFVLIPTEEDADEVSVAKEFRGTAAAKEMPASNEYTDYYVCTGNAFIWVKEAGTIAANRCWLQIGSGNLPASTRASSRAITRGWGGIDGTTGIDAVDNGEVTNEGYYDLNGRKVQNPKRGGIYIHNGKKVIVR